MIPTYSAYNLVEFQLKFQFQLSRVSIEMSENESFFKNKRTEIYLISGKVISGFFKSIGKDVYNTDFLSGN